MPIWKFASAPRPEPELELVLIQIYVTYKSQCCGWKQAALTGRGREEILANAKIYLIQAPGNNKKNPFAALL